MAFDNVYWDQRELAEASKSVSILAIGDSWFWYPFPGGSLLNALGPLVKPKAHTILAFGNNGAEAFDYVSGVYRDSVETGLRFHGAGLSAVFVSGGGNDFAGFNDLSPMLKLDCSSITTARGCYTPGNAAGTLGWVMDGAQESLDALINMVFVAAPAAVKIFLHNYDYAVPSGKGVFSSNGAWLKPALVHAGVRASLHRECIKYLINQFTRRLENLQAAYPGRVILIDSRDTLADADWANELHPNAAGFKKIARQRWLPLLTAEGLA